MITNKDEAFHHNTCKKLAQLSKVIFAMNCLKQDQIDEKSDLFQQFENLLNDINVSHQEKLNEIITLLFKFRKRSINKSCSDYGSLYKNLKKDFISFFTEQNDKFLRISNNIKNTQKEIKTYQVSSLQKAADFFENTDKISSDLKKLKKAELSPNLIKSSTDPIFKKMDHFNKQWKAHISETKNNHKLYKRQLEKDNQISIQQEIRNYYTVWQNLLLKISPIKEEISNYKATYDSIIQNHSNFFISQINIRNEIVDETTQKLIAINNQKTSLTKSLQSCNSSNQLLIRQLENQRLNNRNIFQQMYSKLKQDSHQQQHLRHQFQKSFSSRGEKLQSELAHNLDLLNQKLLIEKDNLLELQANHRKYILLGLQDSERLLRSTSSLIKKSLDNERYNISKMTVKIRQMENSQKQNCENYQASYKTVISQQKEKLESCLQKIFSLNEFHKKVSEKVDELNGLYQKKRLEMNSEIDAYNEKFKLEYKNASEGYKKLLLNKKELNDSIFSQKIERKKNHLNQTSSKFNAELNVLSNSIKEKNETEIFNYKNSMKLSQLNFEESQNHQIQLNKINGRLQFYVTSVEQARQIAEKTVNQLDHEISSIDKKMRQFKRLVKSTIQNIDSEYEMKIQVMQIELNNKIENLSKLFTKEENDRGCEVIEAIRKIRETQNQQLSKSIFLLNEKSHLLRDIEKRKNEKVTIINDFKNCKKENELTEKVESLKVNLNQIIKNENEKLNEEINQLRTIISSSKSENEKRIEEIESEIERENQEFDQKCSDIEQQKSAILDNSKSEIDSQKVEFEKNVKEIKIMHQKEVESIKRRIEYAKKIQKEESLKHEREINDKQEKCHYEIENLRSTQKLNTTENESNSLFENHLIQILNSQLNLYQLFLVNSEETQNIQSRRLRLEFQSVQKTNDLSTEFSNHFQKVSLCSKSGTANISHSKSEDKKISFNLSDGVNIPNENKDENNGNLRSQLFKRLSKYNRGSITESHSHKKMPTLVTPHLVV